MSAVQHPEEAIPVERALERFLAALWRDILGIEQVGVHDNFFELGGDSSGGAILANRVQQALREAVSMATIFEVPTVAGLAARLNRHYPDAVARLCDTQPLNGTEGGTEAGSSPTASQQTSHEGPAQLADAQGLPSSSRPAAWLGEGGVDFGGVEAALLEEFSVEDCAVVARETEGGDSTLVAYVVVSGVFSAQRLAEHMRARLPEALVPGVFVSVSGLPLTGTGELDRRALCRLAVIDDVLVGRWEQRLGSVGGVDEVVVVSEERTGGVPLDDLLPERSRAASAAAPVASLEGSPATSEEDRPMALADGGRLVVPEGSPETLTEALLRTATEHAQKGVTYVRSDGSEEFESYAGLLERASRILAGLQARGLGPGDRAILQVDTLENHYAAFWACVLGGIVPATVAVPLSYAARNAVVEKLFSAWELLGHPPILTSPQLVAPIAGLTRLLPMDGLTLLSVDELEEAPPAEDIHCARPEEVAFLQLTSGSTGVPKCIQELHRSVIAHAQSLRQFNGHTPEDVSLNWMPVDHVGSLLFYHLKDTCLGCRQVHVKTDLILADPLKWLDLLEAHRVTRTWAPNFAYKLVADQLATVTDRTWNLSQVRFLNGGEQATLPVIRDFLDCVVPFGVSERAMQPAFGMAETCTVVTCHNHFDVGTGARRFLKSSFEGRLQETGADDSTAAAFIDLGPPIPGVEIRIVDDGDELLAEGVIGRFQIKGPVVTPGYLNNDVANGEALVGDGWFNSGDLGFILDGRLTLTGREKETIVVRGANFYCYEIEDVVGAVEGVEPTFAGACAVADPATGTEGLAVFFVPREDSAEGVVELARTVRAGVAASLGVSPTYVAPVARAEFPKTTSGKIQRGELKRGLETGRFQDPVRPLDPAVEKAETLPDWFYRRTWRRRGTTSTYPRRSSGAKTVVFLDRSGLGTSVAEREDRYGRPCVSVETGPAFEQLEQNRFCVDPASPGDYRRLLSRLAEDGIGVEEVVHLSSYGAQPGAITDLHTLEAAQQRGACSLLFLLQALAGVQPPDEAVRLLVVSSHAQPVLSSDGVACEHGPLLGLVRTASKEWPWIDCRHVDLQADDLAADADAVLGELRSVTAEREVAYRDGRRWVPRLERIELDREPVRPVPFERDGLYLVTGGLGGVAGEVAKYLLEEHEARLLLVGRTPLPDPEAWDKQTHSETVAERIAVYRALEQFGGDLLYRSADVADPARMRAIVSEAEAHWGRPLDGVIHLAGVFEERMLGEETRETFMASLRPKLQGTWTLHELAEDRPDCAFITFSSVNGLLGAFGAGAYAAANSFLDSFAHHRRRAGLPSACFAWSLWREVGMVRDYPLEKQKLSRAAGFVPISAEQGLDSFLAGLQHDQAHLLVGVDATRSHLRRHVEQPAQTTHRLRAYHTTTNGPDPAVQPDGPQVCDRFGTPSDCDLVRVPELPLTEAGRIDRTLLADSGYRAATEPGCPAPEATSAARTPTEIELACIWADVFQLPQVGIDDEFFELGGHSLLAVRLMRRLNRHFGVELPASAVFDAPTVAGLALAVMQARAQAETLPLSPGQRHMWLFEQHPGSAAVAGSGALRLSGPLDVPALEASLGEICARHEALRTTFHTCHGEPVQIVRPSRPGHLARVDLRELPALAREEEADRLLAREAQRPFDLSRDQMLRATLLRLEDEEHVLLLVVHHIACDAWSLDVLFRELEALYGPLRSGGRVSLAELPVQYADHVVWQRERLRVGALRQSMDYWKKQWAGAPQALGIPTARPLPPLRLWGAAGWEELRMPASLLRDLHALCRRQHVTLFMTLLAAWATLLHRHSGQDDILMFTPFANRGRVGDAGSIGFFATNLVLRHDLAGDPSFVELLERVRETAVDAFSHGELTYEELPDELGPQVLLTGPAFFLRNPETPKLDGLRVERIDSEIDRGEQWYFGLIMSEDDHGLSARLSYDTDSFEATMVARVLGQLRILLESVVADPDLHLSQLPLPGTASGSLAGPAPTAAPAAPRRARSKRFRNLTRRARRIAVQVRARLNSDPF